MKVYLGIDVGSVTTKLAVLNGDGKLVAGLYLPTAGQPVAAVKEGLRRVRGKLPANAEIAGVAVTGSGRHIAGEVAGADLVKNEITCQAVAAVSEVPEVCTIIEIGGQDSKIIIVRDGLVRDFGMNTVCAAGTGSFLDHQAGRLKMSIEELSQRAALGRGNLPVAGRCTVFAESDMIHRQQAGYSLDEIVYGLCRALVRNYLSDVASGKDIRPPVVFQGGVAFNQGMVRVLREEIKTDIIVPVRPVMMGAIGAAILFREQVAGGEIASRFRGFDDEYSENSREYRECPAYCRAVSPDRTEEKVK